MSYRPADEYPGACALASWDGDDFYCVPGPTEVVTVAGRLVAVSFCERCDQVGASEMLPAGVDPWTSDPWTAS